MELGKSQEETSWSKLRQSLATKGNLAIKTLVVVPWENHKSNFHLSCGEKWSFLLNKVWRCYNHQRKKTSDKEKKSFSWNDCHRPWVISSLLRWFTPHLNENCVSINKSITKTWRTCIGGCYFRCSHQPFEKRKELFRFSLKVLYVLTTRFSWIVRYRINSRGLFRISISILIWLLYDFANSTVSCPWTSGFWMISR